MALPRDVRSALAEAERARAELRSDLDLDDLQRCFVCGGWFGIAGPHGLVPHLVGFHPDHSTSRAVMLALVRP